MTAITREGSTAEIPKGVLVAKVDYDHEPGLIAALQDQDALIITMSTKAPRDTQSKLIRAAAKAGVKWIVPNEYSPHASANPAIGDALRFRSHLETTRKEIEDAGVSSWLGLCCGFWYEFSLSLSPDCFGFDLKNNAVTLFDDGETKINVSTWPLCGRAVAGMLSLKLLPENESDRSPTLNQFKNKAVHVSSFLISQKDMLASILRVTGGQESDWTITREGTKARFDRSQQEMEEGKRASYVTAMYSRVFYPDGFGNYERGGELANKALGLAEEDLDKATEVALDYARHGLSYHRV